MFFKLVKGSSFSFLTLETGLGIVLTSFAEEEFIEFLLVIH